MTIDAIGVGSGTMDLPDRPNVLRAFWGESADDDARRESITVLETNIDDMNPEMFPPLTESLLEAGARDAFLTPILGKKGRPAHLLTVLLDHDKVEAVSRAIFRGSTTFGVRLRKEDRICLDRVWKKAATPWGDVRIKFGSLNGDAYAASPEYDDCARLAKEKGVSALQVYDAARAAVVKGELTDV